MAFGYDATLSAFLRQMGVAEQNIYAEARARADMTNRQYTRSLPMWAEQERVATQDVKDDAEVRGVYTSGATARNVAYARNAVAMRQNEAYALSQDEQSNYTLDASRRLADLRRQQAEQELSARTSGALSAAQSAYGS